MADETRDKGKGEGRPDEPDGGQTEGAGTTGGEKPPTGFPEPSGRDPGDISGDRSPYSSLSNPVRDPDPTEWPDPYDKREDPRDPPDPDGQPFGESPHPPTGSLSTSEPHPSKDPEAADRWEGPKRDKLDE